MKDFDAGSVHHEWKLTLPKGPRQWSVVKTDIATGERVGTVADGLTEGGARQAAYALARADIRYTYQPVEEEADASNR